MVIAGIHTAPGLPMLTTLGDRTRYTAAGRGKTIEVSDCRAAGCLLARSEFEKIASFAPQGGTIVPRISLVEDVLIGRGNAETIRGHYRDPHVGHSVISFIGQRCSIASTDIIVRLHIDIIRSRGIPSPPASSAPSPLQVGSRPRSPCRMHPPHAHLPLQPLISVPASLLLLLLLYIQSTARDSSVRRAATFAFQIQHPVTEKHGTTPGSPGDAMLGRQERSSAVDARDRQACGHDPPLEPRSTCLSI